MPKFVEVVVKSEMNEFRFTTGLGITLHGCDGDGSNSKPVKIFFNILFSLTHSYSRFAEFCFFF